MTFFYEKTAKPGPKPHPCRAHKKSPKMQLRGLITGRKAEMATKPNVDEHVKLRAALPTYPTCMTLRPLPFRLYCRFRILTGSTAGADGLVPRQAARASPPVGNWPPAKTGCQPRPAPKANLNILNRWPQCNQPVAYIILERCPFQATSVTIRVTSPAMVDSAPQFPFTDASLRPSWQAPVAGSYRARPASFLPRNHSRHMRAILA